MENLSINPILKIFSLHTISSESCSTTVNFDFSIHNVSFESALTLNRVLETATLQGFELLNTQGFELPKTPTL